MSTVMRVLVTGAARAIGLATAQTLAARGHSVVATARDISTLQGLAGVEAHVLDVTSDDSVTQCLAAVGPLDAIVNNAALAGAGGCCACSAIVTTEKKSASRRRTERFIRQS